MDDDLAEKFITNVKPVSYKKKTEEKEKTHFGYIAQDLVRNFGYLYNIDEYPAGIDEVIDEDGFVNPKDQMFSINYTQIIPLLHKMILKLVKKNESLENRIKIL